MKLREISDLADPGDNQVRLPEDILGRLLRAGLHGAAYPLSVPIVCGVLDQHPWVHRWVQYKLYSRSVGRRRVPACATGRDTGARLQGRRRARLGRAGEGKAAYQDEMGTPRARPKSGLTLEPASRDP